MKKALCTFSAIVVTMLTYGQQFVVTPNGLHDANDSTKTFLIIPCEGKTAKELYDNAIKYIQQNYKNPQEVIKGQIESEYLSFETFSPSAISFKRSGGRATYNLTYRTEINFKDGRVKYEIQNIEIEADDGNNLYFSGNNFTNVAIYNQKGGLKYEEAKTSVEDYFNSGIFVISHFLNGVKVVDEW